MTKKKKKKNSKKNVDKYYLFVKERGFNMIWINQREKKKKKKNSKKT